MNHNPKTKDQSQNKLNRDLSHWFSKGKNRSETEKISPHPFLETRRALRLLPIAEPYPPMRARAEKLLGFMQFHRNREAFFDRLILNFKDHFDQELTQSIH
jgi:hypothetical protein